MDELIKIENREGKKSINARDLHIFLEVQTRFNDWIRGRIEKYGFVEGTDYISLTEKLVSGNNANGIAYYLSLDMAKELSMVENNQKGRQARHYFIEVEKRARSQLPQTFAEALRLAADQAEKIEQQKKALEIAAPKVEFYDTVADSKDAVDMATVAKVLCLPYGRNKLFEVLREKKILMPDNKPYQEYVNRGYFKVIEELYDVRGSQRVGFKTVVYQKGLDYINRLLKNKNVNMEKYYIKIKDSPEKEVTQDEFCKYEQLCGFRPKPGFGPVATGGFSDGIISGRVDYTSKA